MTTQTDTDTLHDYDDCDDCGECDDCEIECDDECGECDICEDRHPERCGYCDLHRQVSVADTPSFYKGPPVYECAPCQEIGYKERREGDLC